MKYFIVLCLFMSAYSYSAEPQEETQMFCDGDGCCDGDECKNR